MILHDRIVDSIRLSAAQVFSTMLGLELGKGEAFTDSAPPHTSDGVVSFIGLAGRWVGTGSLSCSGNLGCRLCELFLSTSPTAVNEEVLDAVAELTNIIIGNVKTDLEPHLGALCLSIPTVIFGRNFRTKTARNAEWSAVQFNLDGEPLVVKLCLAPAEASHANACEHTSHLRCSMEVQ
jgi:chemotaxis protein CheX